MLPCQPNLLPFHMLTCSISVCGTSPQLFENDSFTSHLLVSYEWFPTREGEKSTPVTVLKQEGQGPLSSVYSFLLMAWPMNLSLYLIVYCFFQLITLNYQLCWFTKYPALSIEILQLNSLRTGLSNLELTWLQFLFYSICSFKLLNWSSKLPRSPQSQYVQ